MARETRAHLLVRGPIDAALRVAHRCRDHAVHPLQVQLRAPEAATRHGAHRVAVRRRRGHMVRVRVRAWVRVWVRVRVRVRVWVRV